ncbi:hypothetical protein VIBHAR_07061 [Vibrio campbellii ATCC BAA-1116]|uniref:Uncharacterized protein n=1 Tax=Vibrio campbellii (strain ATCC BAA-1116) TaxID=2902295 RepID=A7N7Z2_VIBC1|nr:hypothetical protein VIBHAR_07061 [Vibrio campbellii ATCC BAA-1116]
MRFKIHKSITCEVIHMKISRNDFGYNLNISNSFCRYK